MMPPSWVAWVLSVALLRIRPCWPTLYSLNLLWDSPLPLGVAILTTGTPLPACPSCVLPPAALSTASSAAVATIGLRNRTPASARAMHWLRGLRTSMCFLSGGRYMTAKC
ncbi:hypothetical protein D9M71_504140 [compost metagenome]